MVAYIGDGGWLPGVPARNLTPEEFEAHQAAIEASVKAGQRLYQMPGTLPGEPKLTDVPGVGEKTAKALNRLGVTTIDELIAADPESLDTALDGLLDYVTAEKVAQWQSDAAKLKESEDNG